MCAVSAWCVWSVCTMDQCALIPFVQSFVMGFIVASGALSKILGPLWGT